MPMPYVDGCGGIGKLCCAIGERGSLLSDGSSDCTGAGVVVSAADCLCEPEADDTAPVASVLELGEVPDGGTNGAGDGEAAGMKVAGWPAAALMLAECVGVCGADVYGVVFRGVAAAEPLAGR